MNGNRLFNAFKLVVKIFFGSTFPASWYISALGIGMCIIFLADKIKINSKIVFLIGFVIYTLCCLNSNYRNMLSDDSIVVIINRIYPGVIYNGFLVSLIWIFLGYVFACKINSQTYNCKKSIIGLIVSVVLLYVEYFIVTNFHLTVDNDCYFMLIPTCYYAFENLVNCKWKSKKIDTELLRKYSTIIYCIHGTLLSIVEYFWISGSDFGDYILKFVIVLLGSLVVAYVICLLGNGKKFKWIRYAY